VTPVITAVKAEMQSKRLDRARCSWHVGTQQGSGAAAPIVIENRCLSCSLHVVEYKRNPASEGANRGG
jgi:hypothetical protein